MLRPESGSAMTDHDKRAPIDETAGVRATPRAGERYT